VRRRARVRSSTGHYTWRLFVATRLRLGPVEREIEVSLVDRGPMIFRMLLGRTALAGAFWIDPSHRALFGRPDAHGHRKDVHPQPELPALPKRKKTGTKAGRKAGRKRRKKRSAGSGGAPHASPGSSSSESSS